MDYTLGVLNVWHTPNQTDRDLTFLDHAIKGKSHARLERSLWTLIEFLCQISKLSHFNFLDLGDFFMHHWFPVSSFFDMATLGGC